MRIVCLFLVGVALHGASSQQEDKIHLNLTYTERNGTACPSGGPIALVTASLQGVSAISAFGNLGSMFNDAFSGNPEAVPKTTGEQIRKYLTTPLSQMAAELPICASYQGRLDAELRWDEVKRAYVVKSGTFVWTATNNSRIDAGGHLLYGRLSSGGTHKLTEGEVRVTFKGDQLSDALSSQSQDTQKTTYTLDLAVTPERQPLVGETGWLVDGGKIYAAKEHYTTVGVESDTVTLSEYQDQDKRKPEFFSKELKYKAGDREVDTQAHRASFAETWLDPTGTQVAIHWEFNKPPVEVEVSVVRPEDEMAYRKWAPEGNFQQPDQPGNTITIHAWAHEPGNPQAPPRKKVKLTFELSDVSKQMGMCINWPQKASASEGLKIRKTENADLDVDSIRSAKTPQLVNEADLTIACFDSGAWGTLKVTATDEDDKPAKVIVLGKAEADLYLPLDENNNHIADAWEQDKGVTGLAATWDEAEVAGHMNKGDGLSLYEKYRGAVVLDGGSPKWTRLEPKEKALFIFDDAGIFDTGAWYSASGIRAYKLRADMAQPAPDPSQEAARVVNTCSGFAKNSDKCGVVVHEVAAAGIGDAGVLGETKGANLPRTVEYCRIFLDTHRAWIDHLVKAVQKAAADKNSAAAQTFEQNGIPHWLVVEAAQSLADPAFKEALLQQQLRSTAIHEVGHACGVPGHLATNDKGKIDEGSTGNRMCYMCYTKDEWDWQYIVLQTVFKAGSNLPVFAGIFCRDADFNCWGHLNVKD